MAKRSTKGADFLARERGLSGPTFTASCSRLFEKRGDEWLTSREKDKEFPLRQSLLADTPLSPEQLRTNEARRKMRQSIHQAKMVRVGEQLHEALQDGDIKRASELTTRFVHLRETQGSATVDAKPPQLRVHVDPDMDMFTKATRAIEKGEYHDVPGQVISSCPQRKAACILQKMRRGMRDTKPIESKGKKRVNREVKGSFYKFKSE